MPNAATADGIACSTALLFICSSYQGALIKRLVFEPIYNHTERLNAAIVAPKDNPIESHIFVDHKLLAAEFLKLCI